MIDYCYHTHTYRCGHASGTEEDYIKAAIKAGYKVIGFSDHVFLPNVTQMGTRGNYAELDDYIYTIKNLAKKYEGKIEIHLGFECEFAQELIEYYSYLKNVKGIEYLIIGQHLLIEDGDLIWLSNFANPDEMLEKYVNTIIEGIKTGLFAYIAHPDLCLRFFKKITPFVESQLRKLCQAAFYYNIPLELNVGGLRNFRHKSDDYLTYPCEEFFRIAKEYHCSFIIGIDAHHPLDFEEANDDIKYLESIIDKYQLNHIKRLKF